MLHQDLTNNLFELLQRGKCINLYGKEKNGSKQVLESLNNLSNRAPIPTIFVHIHVRKHLKSHDNLMTEFKTILDNAQDLNLGDGTILNAKDAVNRWFERNNNQDKPKKVFVCFERLDRLKDPGADEKYNNDFFSFINGLRNIDGVSVLLVTTDKAKGLDFYVNQKPVSGSVIDIQDDYQIPALDKDDILAYLSKNQTTETKHFLTKFDCITEFVIKHSAPLDFADHIRINFLNKLQKCSTKVKIIAALKTYQQDFNKASSPISSQMRMSRWSIWLDKIERSFISIYNLLKQAKRITKIFIFGICTTVLSIILMLINYIYNFF